MGAFRTSIQAIVKATTKKAREALSSETGEGFFALMTGDRQIRMAEEHSCQNSPTLKFRIAYSELRLNEVQRNQSCSTLTFINFCFRKYVSFVLIDGYIYSSAVQ